ncbi:MAG: SRPBCC family protein [Burkholderiaceae bacterium]
MHRTHTTDVAGLIDDSPERGRFRLHRDVYLDPGVFARERERVFCQSWVYVGHVSQLRDTHASLSVRIADVPLVVMRDASGTLGCFHNRCRHKGMLLCLPGQGNRRFHACPYHAWVFDSGGRNVAIKDDRDAAYGEGFATLCHDLEPVAAFAEYRGFLFASLSSPPCTLDQYLGDARVFIDLIVDQSPDGVELVPGAVTYTFGANWKHQIENSIDAYHFTATHPSYLRLLDRRAQAPARSDVAAAVWQGDGGREVEQAMGAFGLRHGHALVWTDSPIERHPLYEGREALRERVGDVRLRWMFRTRQFNVFPNLQLASNAALQMRVIRPIAVDLTEITAYCVAPVGETAEQRRRRLRQYEDFFNPSGLATPDDTVMFEGLQAGLAAGADPWLQAGARGLGLAHAGPDEHARELGISPVQSVAGSFAMADESILRPIYRAWAERLGGAGGGDA